MEAKIVDFCIMPTEANATYSIRIDRDLEPFFEVHSKPYNPNGRDGWIVTIEAPDFETMNQLRIEANKELAKEKPIV